MAVEYVTTGSRIEALAHDFAEVCQFSEEDLHHNRRNRISNSQMIRLGIQAMQPFFSAVMTFAGWMIFVTVVRTFVPGILRYFVFGKIVGGGTIMSLGCLWAVVAGFLQSSKLTFLLFLDVLNGQTAAVEGRVASSIVEEDTQGLDKFHGDKKWAYRYVIKGLELEVCESAYQLLHSQYDEVRPNVKIYYTPRSQMLLSLEPV